MRELLAHTLGGLVQLDWKADESLWCLYADEAQLELALMNLIINARDAMPEGGKITVTGANRVLQGDGGLGLKSGEYVVLSVQDQGCGIAPDLIEQVMEPFFTTKDVGKGTGLGLSMVYGFVKQSGGAIRIDSKVGEGTRVEVWLPRAPAASDTAPQSSKADRAPQAGAAMRVLLVDDHDGVRATTAAMLEDLGHRVTEASEGEALLAGLAKQPDGYDLLITDYAMPHVSGADVIRRAREIMPLLPAIIVTGYAELDSIARRPEDVHVLAKPFTADQLARAIAAALPARPALERAAAE
jgi:CheY-like chemotaxis protein